MESDAELLAAWVGGDKSAGNALIKRHFQVVFRFLRRHTASAEDLTQSTFEALLQQHTRYEGRGNLRSYLLGIARNQMLMHLRREGRSVDGDGDAPLSPGAASRSPSGKLAAKQDQKLLLGALRTLSIDNQITVELYYWEELTTAEIAEALDITVTTVTSRLARAREQLRQAIAGMDVAAAIAVSTQVGLERWVRSMRAQFDAQ